MPNANTNTYTYVFMEITVGVSNHEKVHSYCFKNKVSENTLSPYLNCEHTRQTLEKHPNMRLKYAEVQYFSHYIQCI